MTLNREQLAWAAGFFDGEGHTRQGGKSKAPLNLTISQALSPALLEKFRQVVGVGVIYGPYVHRARPSQKEFWVYNANGFEEVQHCVSVLWPWLGQAKRAQASNALRQWLTKPRQWFVTRGSLGRTCKRGHRVEGTNAYITKAGQANCRECRKIWAQRKSA